ncbi:UbiD family decarboxylase [archaeon]|nr:MAG: UbiD family decarboxylase [archaeon]RLG65766.1 MAG: UbiD family decarboxylase [archaeon]RLG66002.1 MAG: UbiD family decarboxylase [archaeon]HDM23980.1 UbiD family decarboxylase [Candidatus Bathyarchaeota archaeon]
MSVSFRDFINTLMENGLLVTVRDKLSVFHEIAYYMWKYDGRKAVFFENVSESDIPVAGNVCFNKTALALSLGIDRKLLHSYLENSLNHMSKPKEISSPDFKYIDRKVDLYNLPILKHYEKDAGRYVTAGVVFAKDPDINFQNASIHRLLLLDKNTFAIRVVPRHLFKIMQKHHKQGKSLRVSIAIGVHPAVLLAAAYPLEYGENELYLANSLMRNKLRTFYCEFSETYVPSHAEIVLEGEIPPRNLVDEGPFADILCLYDIVRKQPVIKVNRMYLRENPIYHALLPAGMEHKVLMSFPREHKMYSELSKVAEIVDINLTTGSGCWLNAIISIRKRSEEEPKLLIKKAFEVNHSLKHVIIVDCDIDVYNLSSVDFAIATRFQASKDIVILENVRGSSLDPSADQETLLTSKMGIDATAPLKGREKFEKADFPIEVKRRLK